MKIKSKPVNALIILDGWGINPDKNGNAPASAKTLFLDMLEKKYPCSKLLCSGINVGLPSGIMGNSEVGHMNIGAGRKVLQNLVKIDQAIQDSSFFKIQELVSTMEKVKKTEKTLHLIGLISDGGVHSHINHVFTLIDMAASKGITNLNIHAILDGRDTSPKSGKNYINNLNKYLNKKGIGKIATICGRYYAMDRDNRWERIEKAYNLYTLGNGKQKENPVNAVMDAYKHGQTDEFIKPIILKDNSDTNSIGTIKNNDCVIFFNFRADRARQITKAFTDNNFSKFNRKKNPNIADFLCMTVYDEDFTLPVIFKPQHLNNTLGEIISRENICQLRIAETEKYAHVTYFFNGGNEKVFPLEERMLVPSPQQVKTYDEKPEMSANEVALKACEKIKSQDFEFIVLNFANMDMVGHTGILSACIKACEAVDKCVKKVVQEIWETGGTAIVTADHGNAEKMLNKDGTPYTAHTLNPVRFIVAGEKYLGEKLNNGVLGDIAPTVLKIMGIKKPEEMTGKSLL